MPAQCLGSLFSVPTALVGAELDGLILAPAQANYCVGTDERLFKLKPRAFLTADLQLGANDVLSCTPNATPVGHIRLTRGAVVTQLMIGRIYECRILADDDDDDAAAVVPTTIATTTTTRYGSCYWTPVRVRADKRTPNHVRTVDSIVALTRDFVGYAEALSLLAARPAPRDHAYDPVTTQIMMMDE